MTQGSDTLTAVAVMWAFTCVAVVLMVLRLVMRKVRQQDFQAGDYVTVAAMVFIILYCGLTHAALFCGTNNVAADFRTTHDFSTAEISQREIGSKLNLAARSIYCTYIWLQKATVILLYRRLLSGLAWAQYAMPLYWSTIAVSYVMVQIVVFSECDPFALYWQVLPDPGTCAQALVQLIVFGSLSIFTDIMLFFLPFPTLSRIHRSNSEKNQLLLLFSVSVLVIATTAIRLPLTYLNPQDQLSSAILTSAEALASAIVANVPTLYTLRSKRFSTLSRITSVTELPRKIAPPVSSRNKPAVYAPPLPEMPRREAMPLSRERPLTANSQDVPPGEPGPGAGLRRWQRRLTSSSSPSRSLLRMPTSSPQLPCIVTSSPPRLPRKATSSPPQLPRFSTPSPPRPLLTSASPPPRPPRTPTPPTPTELERLVGPRSGSFDIVELGIQMQMQSSPLLPPAARMADGQTTGGSGGRSMEWPLRDRVPSVKAPVVEGESYFNHDDDLDEQLQRWKRLRFI